MTDQWQQPGVAPPGQQYPQQDPTQQAGIPPQGFAPPAQPPPDPSQSLGFEVDLDFGGQEAIHGSIPLPDGIYIFSVEEASIVLTKDGSGHVIRVVSRAEARIDQGREDTTTAGRRLIDNWFLPDRVRQSPEAFNTTRGYLRGKLEAVTNKEWGQDGMRLNVRELPGSRYKALVVLRDEGDGYGPQNRVQRYMPLSMDTTGIPVVPQTTARRPQNGGAPAQGGQPAQAGTAPRFRI